MKHDEIYESQNDITNPNDNDDDELQGTDGVTSGEAGNTGGTIL